MNRRDFHIRIARRYVAKIHASTTQELLDGIRWQMRDINLVEALKPDAKGVILEISLDEFNGSGNER